MQVEPLEEGKVELGRLSLKEMEAAWTEKGGVGIPGRTFVNHSVRLCLQRQQQPACLHLYGAVYAM